MTAAYIYAHTDSVRLCGESARASACDCETLSGCGAHCMSCTAVGTSVTCTAGMCDAEYALDAEANDINSACVGQSTVS